MPCRVLPEIRLPVMTLLNAPVNSAIPAPVFGAAVVPEALVPMRLLRMMLLNAPGRLITIPSD